MANVLLPILPGNIGQGYCFTDWQTLLVDFSNAQQALLPGGMAFYSYGDTTPAPEYEAYPWLKSTSTELRWYRFDGDWVSPHPIQDSNVRQIYVGDLTALETYDGGAAGVVSNRSGPMWEEDTTFIGRIPIGVGLIPGTTTPAITTTVYDDTKGAAEHTLTDAEGAVGQHAHPFGITNPGNDDAYFARSGINTVPAYTGYYITGSNGNIVAGQTTADLNTLPSGLTGAGVTPTPFQIVPPVVGVYVIKRTQRVFYVA